MASVFYPLKNLTFPKGQILNSSKLKKSADDNFQLNVHQKGLKHCGERRIFLLQAISPFPRVFKVFVSQTHENKGLFGRGVRTKVRNTCKSTEVQILLKNLMPQTVFWQILWHLKKYRSSDNIYFAAIAFNMYIENKF